MNGERGRTPRFVVERAGGVRLLALDTATAIDIERFISKKPQKPMEAARTEGLLSRLNPLVASRKLVCFQNGQDEEYSASTDAGAVADCLSPLTLGIETNSRMEIRYREIREGMTAYRTDAEEVHLPLSVFFRESPVETIQRIARDRIFVGCTPLPPVLAGVYHRQKSRDQVEMEAARMAIVKSGVGYTEQVLREKLALPQRLAEGRASSAEVDDYSRLWAESLDGGKTTKSLADFFMSPYFLELPTNRVEAELGADLMTSPIPIKSGDFNDMSLLTVSIPVADYVLTDGAMRDRVRRRKVAASWGTKVYSPKCFNELFVDLDSLMRDVPAPTV